MTATVIILCIYLGLGACFAVAMRLLSRAIDDMRDEARRSFWEIVMLEVTLFASLMLCWPLAFLVFCFSENR